ncbi:MULTISPECIES: hypothetical protein [Sorangium]|uniref:Uncharacterized protein n=1 Tax=Sorangium cellulosum TaxID=56 RepID=A0A4P2QJH7_SORCE|nr:MULTISPECIES: hypothetical protein [Sorangium]AUX29858.1 uncharacterized protein SOCE836_019510 [Sorangium cellulosum]WCQ89246.1 hypothetical protein NQZ70_01933 [Sorangium sp. Soce836]
MSTLVRLSAATAFAAVAMHIGVLVTSTSGCGGDECDEEPIGCNTVEDCPRWVARCNGGFAAIAGQCTEAGCCRRAVDVCLAVCDSFEQKVTSCSQYD